MKQLLFMLIILSPGISFAQLSFTRITDSANPVVNISSTPTYRGASWVDIDGDGDIDLFAAPSFLFRNDGAGSFSEVDNVIGSRQTQNPSGSTWADFDNDGDIDCFLARNPSRLYRNDGTGNFRADDPIFEEPDDYPGWAASFGDFNNDGRLDLVIAHPAGFLGPSTPSFFFIAQPGGTLKKDTVYNFTKTLAPYTVPYWSDFDLDGDADLFIASGPGGQPGPDYLYKNLKMETGADSLIQISDLPFASANQDGQCYNFIDYDNDQDLDLFLTNWQGAQNRFYRNNDGMYEEIDVPFDYNSSSLANTWGDLDNDGDLDLLIANDQNRITEAYVNNGDGTFSLSSGAVSDLLGSACISLGDYDNDGDLDFFAMGNSNGRGLFRNEAQDNNNNWINILCEGSSSNRSAIGAKVKIKAVISGMPVWQFREISAQNTFQGQNDLRVHFGLGDASAVDSLIIIYQGGQTEIFTDIPLNAFYYNIEGSGSLDQLTGIGNETGGIIPREIILYQNYPNPFNPVTTIKFDLAHDKEISIKIINIKGEEIKSLLSGFKSAGSHSVTWDGKDNMNNYVSSGIYFLRLKEGSRIFSRKMIMLK